MTRGERDQALVSAMHTLAVAQVETGEPGRRRHAVDSRAAPPRGHTGVHDLDRVTERVSVLPLVQAVELLQARVVEPPFRQGHSDSVSLAGIAAVETHLDLDGGLGDTVATQRRAELGGGLVEIPVQPRLVEPPFDHEDRAHLVVAQVARQQTGGRRDPRVRRDENLGNRECSATSHAWSGHTPPNATSAKSRGSWPF